MGLFSRPPKRGPKWRRLVNRWVLAAAGAVAASVLGMRAWRRP